jgi:hypothetical protein
MRVAFVYRMKPVFQRQGDGFFILRNELIRLCSQLKFTYQLVLHRILLERFIRLRLQVIHKRLQGCLDISILKSSPTLANSA